MIYSDIREKAGKCINQTIEDYRPASGLFIEGMDTNEQIPNAIICWLANGDQVIYIVKGKKE